MIKNKLLQIEKKIIVGGENLLEKAEEQERLLEESAKELDRGTIKQMELRRQLEEKEVINLLLLSLGCKKKVLVYSYTYRNRIFMCKIVFFFNIKQIYSKKN